MDKKVSPFLDPGFKTTAGTLAIAHLSRDNLQPILIRDSGIDVDGYAEGAVLNTRFGSFPHSTLANVVWGSQVRASAVDTGTRGRKRRREETNDDSKDSTPAVENQTDSKAEIEDSPKIKNPIQATSGFIHLLPPTPEIWTSSLPHRTQVVYTPDYSYILQRIQARPGTRLIEAGAGSGSFTHASARAVYNGYPTSAEDKKGKVWSFEFHEERFNKMTEEIKAHGLEGIVQLTHRDVYGTGFAVDGKSPEASAVFLDLPAPWEALPHLSRQKPANVAGESVSPLDPKKSVYLCTFSPCIEQVMRTISTMRALGWVEIEMVEIMHKKINISRDRVGLGVPTERGHNSSPRDVGEAVSRLAEIEKRMASYHSQHVQDGDAGSPTKENAMEVDINGSAVADLENPDLTNGASGKSKKFMEGRLVHRTEPEIRTHTSYLVFAILPQDWSEDDEAAALARWPCGNEKKVVGALDKEARKSQKRELLQGKKKRKGKAHDGEDVRTEI
jgi:tRNA (adenine57-N1/adenine58-N1)-methyltransferase catalytic subunit